MLGSFPRQIWLQIHLLCDLQDFSQAVTSSSAAAAEGCGLSLRYVSLVLAAGDFGMFREEGSDLHEGHTHISPLEGRKQKMRLDVPEPCRCPCL